MRTLIVLAGGQSRRMGRDKALLPAGDHTLLSHVVTRLGPAVDEVIVAGARAEDPDLKVRWVADPVPGIGPLVGIGAGLRVSRSTHAWVVACDLPHVEPGLGDLLFREAPGYDAVVPRPGQEPEGVCAVYSTALSPRIDELLGAGHRSVMSLLERSKVRYLAEDELRQVDPQLRSFRNLNTTADYEQWLSSI